MRCSCSGCRAKRVASVIGVGRVAFAGTGYESIFAAVQTLAFREETMPHLRSLPAEPVMRDLYRAYPATCKPLGELTEAAMRGRSPFTPAERELIAAYVSGLNACVYCHTTHVAVAEACGVEPD